MNLNSQESVVLSGLLQWRRLCLTLCAVAVLAAQSSFLHGVENGVPKPWNWQPSLVPKVLFVEGLWGDFFQIEPAMHAAGLPYRQAYVSRSPYFGVYTRLFNMPSAEELKQFSAVVIVNLDAPALTAPRLETFRQFVSEGGGLVVLGGFWAFSQGGYNGTVLEEMLPVTFSKDSEIVLHREGVALKPAPQSTWKMPYNFEARPSAFYIQRLQPKKDAATEILAAGDPVLVSGAFGKGRVVACGLCVNGEAPSGVLPFWEWPQWRQLLGQAVDWAAGARPLGGDGIETTKPLLTDAEVSALMLGGALTPEVAQRFCAKPDPACADAVLASVLSAEANSKVQITSVFRALLPFAKNQWGPKLRTALEKFSPDIKGRQAELILLGASKDSAAQGILLEALQKDPTKDAALEGFGRLGEAAQIPLIKEVLARAEAACKNAATPDDPAPGVFAREQGSTIVEAVLALYRLGDPEALPRLLEVYRFTRLYERIYKNAIKRRVTETDQQGIGILRRLHEGAQNLEAMMAKLRDEAGPVPASQIAAFVKVALEADEPTNVEWLCLALEQSGSVSPVVWKPLQGARDQTVVRMAAALAKQAP